MSDATRTTLRNLIRERYEYFRSRLTYRLGAQDQAEDALHDAFVRLERAELAKEVRQPTAYILRMASNAAANRRRSDRHLSIEDAREALDVADDAQRPDREVEFESDMALVREVMRHLPERRRTLLAEAWLDEVPTAELAMRHGIAIRTVQQELKLGLEQLQRAVSGKRQNPLRRTDREVS